MSTLSITTPPKRREWLARKLGRLIARLDNSGNANISKNGEESFIRSLLQEYRGKEFTFLDVGANIGEYTDLILEHAGSQPVRGFLFEPQKKCLEILSRKFGTDPRLALCGFGLSESERSADLFKDADASGLASVYKRDVEHYNIAFTEVEPISLKTGASVMATSRISHIDLMKIDIEGHELMALRGFGEILHADKFDFIQFEYGGANLDSRTSLMDLFRFFTERGFSVCKLMRDGLESRPYDPRFENGMYQNYVAVSSRIVRRYERP